MALSRYQQHNLFQAIIDALWKIGMDYHRSAEFAKDNKVEILFEPLDGTDGPEIKLLIEEK